MDNLFQIFRLSEPNRHQAAVTTKDSKPGTCIPDPAQSKECKNLPAMQISLQYSTPLSQQEDEGYYVLG